MNLDQHLPVEIWLKILHQPGISTGDLCSFMCVSRYLSFVAASPELWTRCSLNKEKVKEEGLDRILSAPRLSLLQTLDMSDSSLTAGQIIQTMSAIKASDTLEEINFKSVDLSEAPADLLVEVLIDMKIANLSTTNLSEEQCIAVLNHCEAYSLVDLNLRSVHNLKKVPPELIKNLTNIGKLNLAQTNLSPPQITVLFANIPSSKLTDLNVFCLSLRNVDSATIAEGFSHLEKVDFSQTWLTPEQSSDIFTKCLGANRPKEAIFDTVELSAVPPQILAAGVARLNAASLSSCFLTTEQSSAIFSQILQGTSLQHINLQNNNLSQVSPLLAADGLSLVEKVNVGGSKLTPEQISLLLTQQNSCIKDINLHAVKLSKVSGLEAFTSMSRFRKLQLSYTSLSTEQSTCLFTRILEGESLLRELDLTGVNLSAVDASLLAMAVGKMEKVNLDLTRMSTEHMEKVLEAVCTSDKLTQINLEEERLARASPAVFERAKNAKPKLFQGNSPSAGVSLNLGFIPR